MAQGVKHASHCFKKTTEGNLIDLEDCILPPYYDDFVIRSHSFESHSFNARLVLERFRQSGFTLSAFKCNFFQTKLLYLSDMIEIGAEQLRRRSRAQKFPSSIGR